MGLLDLFGKNKATRMPQSKSSEDIRKEAQAIVDSFDGGKLSNILANSDTAIRECQKADEQFKIDGDIDKIISVYEKFFTEKTGWSSFNFNLKLAKLYVKAGRNNDAWAYLNKMTYWAMQPDAINMDLSKIRFEQFKILKAEKKYKDALINLVLSYVEKGQEMNWSYFNKNKFISDAKTTAKKAGITEVKMNEFADKLEKAILKNHIRDESVKQFCVDNLFE